MSKIPEKFTLLISGFLRIFSSNGWMETFPLDLYPLIFNYFNLNSLDWDVDKNSKYSIFFLNDSKIANYNNSIEYNGFGYSMITAKPIYTVSSTICNKFYCEIRFIQKGTRSQEIDLSFGFIDIKEMNKLKESNNFHHHMLGKKNGEYGIYVSDGRDFAESYMIEQNHGNKLQIGSRIRNIGDTMGYQIDFITNKTTFYYNSKNVGVIFTDAPSDILPAIALFDNGAVVSCTKFNIA